MIENKTILNVGGIYKARAKHEDLPLFNLNTGRVEVRLKENDIFMVTNVQQRDEIFPSKNWPGVGRGGLDDKVYAVIFNKSLLYVVFYEDELMLLEQIS